MQFSSWNKIWIINLQISCTSNMVMPQIDVSYSNKSVTGPSWLKATTKIISIYINPGF